MNEAPRTYVRGIFSCITQDKKILIILILFLVIGLVGIYYYFNLPKPSGVVPQARNSITAESNALFRGNFIKIDNNHYASGTALIKLIEEEPILEFRDFTSAKGPDLFVYLSKNANLSNVDSDPGEFVSLGVLKNSSGLQQYNLPEDYADYKSVLIWCRAFNVLFSSADLK